MSNISFDRKRHMKKYIKGKEPIWWNYFEFKEPKLKIINRLENFFNLKELNEKYFKYALATFIIVGLIILLLF